MTSVIVDVYFLLKFVVRRFFIIIFIFLNFRTKINNKKKLDFKPIGALSKVKNAKFTGLWMYMLQVKFDFRLIFIFDLFFVS